GWNMTIFADETGQQTTSAAAAAVWFPYDAEPTDKVIPWALTTYERLRELARDSKSGVSIIELRQFTRAGEIAVPAWAINLGPRRISESRTFPSGFALAVPLTDTTIYLEYLADRFRNAGGTIQSTHI